jgi:hypothetical protein
MGCTLPCCDDYAELKDEVEDYGVEVPSSKESPSGKYQPTTTATLVGKKNEDLLDLDLSSPVFKGTTCDQKFSNKSTYDQKFIWINIHSRTINLSEYKTKEKRHKEAGIADIVNVVAGPPEKYKATTDANGSPEKMNIGLFLSVTFIRGGGIDLRFASETERDAWYLAITKLMANHRAATNAKKAVGMGNYE